jgi:hypothetical protein
MIDCMVLKCGSGGRCEETFVTDSLDEDVVERYKGRVVFEVVVQYRILCPPILIIKSSSTRSPLSIVAVVPSRSTA